jgi:hypothetical protein
MCTIVHARDTDEPAGADVHRNALARHMTVIGSTPVSDTGELDDRSRCAAARGGPHDCTRVHGL